MNKKVLIYADPHSVHTVKWLEGWRRLGYETIVSGLSNTICDNKFIFKSKINIKGGNGSEFLKNIFKFKKVLDSSNPNIINAHFLTSYGLIGALLKRKNDKLVIFLMGTDVMITMNRNFIYLYMAKYIFNKSNLLVSSSQTMSDKILKYFPYLEDKILTQQYGIDISLLDKYQSKDKDIDILTNRGWVANSNYEILLDIFNKFKLSKKALIGYNGTDYAKELKQKYPNLESSIYNMLEYKDNISMVGRCKIFISLTTSDGMPLSLLEAMYLGAIPIVSDIPTNHEVINNGINGFIIPIDAKSLYQKIEYVLSLQENRLNEIRDINRELIKDKFDIEKSFYKMNSLI